MMDPDRWRQIDALLLASLERPPDERVRFIEAACGGDEKLKSEVLSLLSSDGRILSLIEKPAFEGAIDLLATHIPELNPGQSIGHYRVISFLGAGGMGEVYLAEDTKLDRKVAIKLLSAENNLGGKQLNLLEREARAASALNHPNIITIYEIGRFEDKAFIVSEFIAGATLRQHLHTERLTVNQALDIASQIARALSVAHDAGIVHRDIKPENIMLRADGYIKVLDFGLAKLTEQSEPAMGADFAETPDISSGLVLGTVKYMSPEQARGQQVDASSDIFSLGVVLYEMITAHAPFEGESSSNLVRSILNDEPRSLTEYVADTPEELQRIVSKALGKDKTKRYRKVEDLLVDLKALNASNQHNGVRAASATEHFLSQIRKYNGILATGLISLLILLAGIAYPLKKWISNPATPSEKLQVTTLTTSGNLLALPAISADGKKVAYVTVVGGIRILELTTNEDMQVTPAKDVEGSVTSLVFAPDGHYLYYIMATKSSSSWQLYRSPTSGGPPEKIADDLPSEAISFSPDFKEFAFIRQDLGQGRGTLVIASADGTAERSIVSRKAPNYFAQSVTSWAPDGKSIAYVAQNADDGYQRIFEVNLETKFEKPLTSHKWDDGIGALAWLPDGSSLLFTAANSPISQAIWRLSFPGGDLQRITNEAGKYIGLSVAGDSKTLITAQFSYSIETWIAPDADASRARRVNLSSHDGFYGIVWTPDGKIVYTRETRDGFDIWIANADGTDQKQLTKNAHQNVGGVVTGDGHYIVFQSNRAGADHIWRMDIDGGNQTQLTFGQVERNPNCSKDSNWVVYNAWESGHATVWKIPVEGGTPQQINDVTCFNPIFSHDGKLIACMHPGTSVPRVLICTFEGGAEAATIDLPPTSPGFIVGWTPDDRGIVFGIPSDRVVNYWTKPIDGGPSRQLTFFNHDQRSATTGSTAALSPDGKDLLYQHEEDTIDMVMISLK